jgi:hypothetical protein
MTSRERVAKLIRGEKTDRTAIFDLLRNDAAIEYYSGEKLTWENAERLVYKASGAVLDATRSSIKYPQRESETVLPDGRRVVQTRWTTWNEHMKFAGEEEYVRYLKTEYIDKAQDGGSIERSVRNTISRHSRYMQEIGDTFLFWGIGGVGLVNLHAEVGLDQFSYYLCDCPEAVSDALEANTEASVRKIRLLHEYTKDSDMKPEGVFVAEDIAFKGTTMFSPQYLKKEFFPRLKRITEACHQAGWKFIFHSDGNLMNILEDLAGAGIDILNPLEVEAGMDIKEIHRRYPQLILTGGIDVSNLLPFGKPEEIRDAVVKAIEDAEGKIMVGSSTEMHHEVPLKNVLALYETAMNYRY